MKFPVYASPVARTVPFENDINGLNAENLQDYIDLGTTTKNTISYNFSVQAGYTRLHPNLTIPDGLEVTIEDDAELGVV